MLDPRFKHFDFKRGTSEMRDKAKKYLVDTYLADWGPKPTQLLQTTARPSTTPAPAPLPQKVVSKGFLDDTDDEDEDDEDEGKSIIAWLSSPFRS
jgi:hypothetical protein